VTETARYGSGAASAALLPRVSISEVTLPDLAFEEDVELFAAAGLRGIGIWESKIEHVRIEDAVEMLARHGLHATNCVPVGNSVFPYALSPDPVEPACRVEELRRRIERLAAVSPECLVIITGPAPDGERARSLELCRSAFASLARTACDAGITLALEPMHPSAAPELCLFDNLVDAGAFLDELDEPGLGLLVDSWHVGQDPELDASLAANASRIAGVHLADHRAGANGWVDRAFPGEGLGESRRLIVALERVGFSGSLDVEIFSDDGRYGSCVDGSLWRLPAAEIVARATRFARADS